MLISNRVIANVAILHAIAMVASSMKYAVCIYALLCNEVYRLYE